MVLIFFNNFLWEEKDKWFLDHSATVHKSTHSRGNSLSLSLSRLSAGNGNDYTQMDTLYLLSWQDYAFNYTQSRDGSQTLLCSTNVPARLLIQQQQQ